MSNLTLRRLRRSSRVIRPALLLALSASSLAGSVCGEARRVCVYSHLLEPREHPDYDRRVVKPPSWDTFGRRTHFTSLRGFNVEGNRIVGYAEEIEKYTRRFELGDVLWPSYPILFATNLVDLAAEVQRRQLFLFDIWGYVPGSGPGGYWQQFKPPPAVFPMLQSKLGDRWLGTDIGEQDGRYIGGYANQMTPASASRFQQHLNFQRHFERMGDDLGHRHAALVSLNFGHYFLKEGTYTLIGAETAQALPNNQVYYAFIRGAGKQYGVPWFGNASIYNRWGFKTYGSSGRSDGYDFGPTKGTSLSLMKRLLYSHILYNSMVAGFENGWFEGDQLSPIGRIQQSAQRWVKEHGQPGVMHTPVALVLDFDAGWTFPRHLYSDQVYRVWGNLPYEPGDYFTDGLLDMLYPGYQNSSYFHDESGFITRTPYGDIADCLLSDAPLWLLQHYPVVIAAGELGGGAEIAEKLRTYTSEGGHLVVTGNNLKWLWPQWCSSNAVVEAGGTIRISGWADDVIKNGATKERLPFEAYRLLPKSGDRLLAWNKSRGAFASGNSPLAIERRFGRGRVTMFAATCGVTAQPQGAEVASRVDQGLRSPHPLLEHVELVLDRILRAQGLFETVSTLSLITCRKAPGEYTLGVLNNQWHELPLKISSRCGTIESIRELPLDQSEKGALGYAPEGVEAAGLGRSSSTRIAGGDVRVFAIKVAEHGVEEIPHRPPPSRPRNRLLPLRHAHAIKEEILARPTFFEHFDGVVVDWRYLHDREKAALQREAGWIRRQGLRVMVDLSSGINLYPTLRLIDNLAEDYEASMVAIADVMLKMEALGARDLILSLHRHPENNFTEDQTRLAFVSTLKVLAGTAADRGVTLHLRMAFGKPPWNLAEARQWLERVHAPNLKLAHSIALLDANGPQAADAANTVKDRIGLWLISGARKDVAGRRWDAHAPLHTAEMGDAVARWLALAPEAPIALDAVYDNQDDEYLDAVALDRVRR